MALGQARQAKEASGRQGLCVGGSRGQSRQWAQLGHGRDVPRGEAVSNFRIVSMTWMDVFSTPASSENSHSIIVQEMVILPTSMKTDMEPNNSRHETFPGNHPSSGDSCAKTQVASEASRPSVQVYS